MCGPRQPEVVRALQCRRECRCRYCLATAQARAAGGCAGRHIPGAGRMHAARQAGSAAGLQAQGHHVAMVGDGLNDGPVIGGANVSFAFGRSVPLAQSRADFVVLGDSLTLVAQAVLLARQHLARCAAESMVGCRLQRAVRALGCGGLDAGLAGGAGHGAQLAAGGAECRPPCPVPCRVRRHLAPYMPEQAARRQPLPLLSPIFGWEPGLMDILYLLIPLSVVLVLDDPGRPVVGVYPASSRAWSKRASAFSGTVDMRQ
jgi:hypothetical protein